MAVRLKTLPKGAVVLEDRPAPPASPDATDPEEQLGLQLHLLAVRHGLEAPQREYAFLRDRHLQYRADYAWPTCPSGRKVLIEMEGGTRSHEQAGAHMRPVRYERDCVKYSFAALEGWTVIRATPAMVEDGRALLLVEHAVLGDIDHIAAVQQRTREVAPKAKRTRRSREEST